MEFRKTMDIDHILDWQPPEVSPAWKPLGLIYISPKKPPVTGDREGKAAAEMMPFL